MSYCLLTGATGLLGRYLLRDLTRAGIPLAVVVRGTQSATPRQRIEEVMRHWEAEAGVNLPRPVVLEGELTKTKLGLDDDQISWVRENCNALIHNAASVNFIAESLDSEPYPSNVQGADNILDLCRRTEIKELHHVSSSYVSGTRTGRILETELDENQQFRNDYEKSKYLAETAIREATQLERVTTFRPGIIIGDSHSGYTSTYRGFYVPLSSAYGILGNLHIEEKVDPVWLLELFGLTGEERKNFVPVDWVSKIIIEVFQNKAFHGKTYHLTPPNRTVLTDMMSVMIDSLFANPRQANSTEIDLNAFEEQMREQLEVYRAYWSDDPEYDTSNTSDSLPEIPCPEVDADCLRRTCDFALKHNFGWKNPAVEPPEFDAASLFPRRNWKAGSETDGAISLRVTGPGGGDWTLFAGENGQITHCEGAASDSPLHLHLSSSTLSRLKNRSLSWEEAFRAGRISCSFLESAHPDQAVFVLNQLLNPQPAASTME